VASVAGVLVGERGHGHMPHGRQEEIRWRSAAVLTYTVGRGNIPPKEGRPSMSIVLYHHPYSRAAGTVWALEEVGVDYKLRWVDIQSGAQKAPEIVALNPMGKLPLLTDGDQVVTEAGAIALYLADRYAYGKLAPAVDDPARGTYLRWSFFAPSVIEPGAMAKSKGWRPAPVRSAGETTTPC